MIFQRKSLVRKIVIDYNVKKLYNLEQISTKFGKKNNITEKILAFFKNGLSFFKLKKYARTNIKKYP